MQHQTSDIELVDWSALRSSANGDPEFSMHARHWTGVIRIGIGRRAVRMSIVSGQMTEVQPWLGRFASNLSIDAASSEWRALLEPIPRPFFQDLHAASIHHGFSVSGDLQSYCAYYPAVRRLVELMRAHRRQEDE